MPNAVKCSNCGSALQVSDDKPLLFCPYCGNQVKQKETVYDFARSMVKEYNNIKDKQAEEEKRRQEESSKHAGRDLFIIGLVIALGVGIFYFALIKPHQDRVAVLETLRAEIQTDILNGNYTAARLKANDLRLSDGYSSDDDAKWDATRNELLKIIEEEEAKAASGQ